MSWKKVEGHENVLKFESSYSESNSYYFNNIPMKK